MDTTVSQQSLLEVRDCKQAYHKDASADLVVLEDVNLSLREGEMVGAARSFGVRQVDAAAYRRRSA